MGRGVADRGGQWVNDITTDLQVLAGAVGWRRGVQVVGRRAVAADGVQVVERRVGRLGRPIVRAAGERRRTGRQRRRSLRTETQQSTE